jgi:hypothetical protein
MRCCHRATKYTDTGIYRRSIRQDERHNVAAPLQVTKWTSRLFCFTNSNLYFIPQGEVRGSPNILDVASLPPPHRTLYTSFHTKGISCTSRKELLHTPSIKSVLRFKLFPTDFDIEISFTSTLHNTRSSQNILH